ncbi:MAG: hypothetical protein H6Q74_1747 [Firmicutes bacterium]|nr:hypothetical protein [Bacillota bacterium]
MKAIYVACAVFFCLIFGGGNTGHCAVAWTGTGMYNAADVYQETLWMNIDASDTQRGQIDAIIADKNKEVQKITTDAMTQLSLQQRTQETKTPGPTGPKTSGPGGKNRVQTPAPVPRPTNNINLINYLRVFKKIDDIKLSANDEIKQCLTVEQQVVFDTNLEQRQNQVANLVVVLVGLDMDGYQQTQVIRSLLLSKQQIWKAVADTSSSWDKRLKRAQTVNTFKQICNNLTPEQQDLLNTYLMSMD